MSFITAALIIGGTTAAAGVAGAVINSNASKNAANAQTSAANSAIQTQQGEFNTINSEYAPNRNLGYGADNLLAQLFGIGNPTAAGASNAYPGANYSPAGPTALPSYNAGAPGTNGASVAVPGVSGASGGMAAQGTTLGTGGTVVGSNVSGGPLQAGSTAIPGTGATAGTPAGGGSAAVGGAAQNPNYSNFYNSPGYQFTLGQGEQAINRSASSAGNAYSSTTLGALNNYAQGAASTQYNNYVGQLMGLAGLGANATQGTAAAAQTTGNNISSAQLGIGNANASGIAGQASAWNSALGGVTSGLGIGALGTGNYNPTYTDPSTSAAIQGLYGQQATAAGYIPSP